MNIVVLFFLVFISSTSFAQDDFTRVLKGTCDVEGYELKANFYIRNTDRHFDFDFVDSDGNVQEDTSRVHRQNIFTEDYGIKLRKNKIVIKSRQSYYHADFIYNLSDKTAVFKHKYSCIRDWFFKPCKTYVEKYKVKFTHCTLDFNDVLDVD